MTYMIPVENIDDLRKRVVRIQEKAVKYGVEIVYNEIGEEIKTETYTDDEGKTRTRYHKYIELKPLARLRLRAGSLLEPSSIRRLATSSEAYRRNTGYLKGIRMPHRIVSTAIPKGRVKTHALCTTKQQAPSNRLARPALKSIRRGLTQRWRQPCSSG